MKYLRNQIVLIIILTLSNIHLLFAGFIHDNTPLDQSIRFGCLANGFTYYIKDVPGTPKVKMNLYVKVGIHNESPLQMEFSHIIEHLAFTSAKHFSTSLKDSLKKMKIKTQGTTGAKATSYDLSSSSNHMDTLKIGLQWFRDIANLKFTEEKINNERGIIEQEANFKVGYRMDAYFQEQSLFSKLFSIKPDHSKLIEQLQSFSVDSVIKFYKRWYQPQKMGIVLVGDFKNINDLEEHIVEKFRDIPAKKYNLPIATYNQSDYLKGPNRFVTHGSKKWGNGKKSVRLYLLYRDKALLSIKNNTIGGLHRKLIWLALQSMIRKRIQDQHLKEVYFESPKPWHPFYQIIISNNENTEQQVLLKSIKLLHQIKTYGFNQKEWSLAIDQVIKQLGDGVSATYWKDQMYNHFLYQEALPENKMEKSKQWLTQLPLKQINIYANQYLSARPNDIGILARDGHKAISFSEPKVRGMIDEIINSDIQPYESPDEVTIESLMSPQEIFSLKKIGYSFKEICRNDIEEIQLNNGIKVVLHRQKQSGQIQIHGFSPKGALCFSESDYFSAINAPWIIRKSGVGQVSGQELQKFISSNGLYFNTYINPLETGIKLSGSYHNFTELMQLIYLAYSKPIFPNINAFENWKYMEQKNFNFPYMPPKSMDFKVAIAKVLNDSSIELLPGGKVRHKGIEHTDREKAYKIYRQLFGNAKDFTFVLSGDFSKETILPIIQRYLGNLSNLSQVFTCNIENNPEVNKLEVLPKPLYKEFLTNELDVSYRMNNSSYYLLRFIGNRPDYFNWKEDIKIKILGSLINDKLKSFRYEKGASLYNFYCYSNINRYLDINSLNIFMECTTQELEWLRKESKKMIDKIQKHGFSSDDFRMAQERFYKNSLEKGSKPNEVYEYYRYNSPLSDKKEQAQYIKNLTMENIKETALKYLIKENMMEFVLKDSVSIN